MDDQNPESRRSFIKKSLLGMVSTAAFPLLVSDKLTCAAPSRLFRLENFPSPHAITDDTFWEFIQQQFPLAKDLIYMNNGGLGPSPYPVIEAVYSEMLRLESISETGHDQIARVREKAAKFFNCGTDEIAFTTNATEGMNIIARGLPLNKTDEVLMSTHEHPGGSMPWIARAKDTGIRVKLFEPGETAEENLNIIASNITPRTKVLSLSHILCTTGLIFPVEKIAELCRQKQMIYVLDGAQAAGMIPLDLNKLGCDFYVSSGHKWLCGPKGTGLFYVRRNMLDQWHPSYVGAYSDKIYQLEQQILEFQKEAKIVEYGTRNTPLVIGMGAALDFFAALGMNNVAAHGRFLAAYLKNKLLKINKIELLTPNDPEVSGSIVTFKILAQPQAHTEIINRIKRDYNIRLRPVGEHGLNAIRVSLHVYNDFEQVDKLVYAIKKVILS